MILNSAGAAFVITEGAGAAPHTGWPRPEVTYTDYFDLFDFPNLEQMSVGSL